MSGVKISGKVKWFNNAKGYGFIIEDGKTEDLFAHFSAIQMDGYKTLRAGQAVEFEIIQGPKGLHAVAICAPNVAETGKTHEVTHEKKSETDHAPHSKKSITA